MTDQVLVQEWQPFFMTLAGAAAALAGLVFVAMSLHPQPILTHPLMRARAFAAAFGFLIGVAWAFIMLLPARTAPLGSFLLIAVGVGGIIFVAYQQMQDPQDRHECRAGCPQRYPRTDSCRRRNRGVAAARFRIPIHAAGNRGWRGAFCPLLPIMEPGAAQHR